MLTYTLLVSKQNFRDTIHKKIQEIPEGIYRLYKVSGEYDLLVEIKLQNETKMKEVLNKIKSFDGVMDLKTLTVLHKTKEHDHLPKPNPHVSTDSDF